MQPYGGYPPPPQPPRSGGSNVGVIVGIVVGVLLVLFVLGGVVAGIAISFARRAAHASPAAASTPALLTETYRSKNGLIEAHYPSDFAAKSLDEGTINLAHNFGDGEDELVNLIAIEHPISDDVNEFSRLLLNAMKKKITDLGDTWVETGRRNRTCWGTKNGLEIDGYYNHGLGRWNVRSCYWTENDKGYEVKTIVPDDHKAELVTLQQIADATVMK